jgi:mannose-6-phosphate isomerase-like protein (cupin superfamily)
VASKPERIGAALAKALKVALKGDTAGSPAAAGAGPPIVRANIRNVAKRNPEPGISQGEIQVQVLIDRALANAGHSIGWSVVKPGARQVRHRHDGCDEFFLLLKGRGHILSDLGEEPATEGDIVYAPRGAWHGFHNTSDEDAIVIWGWMGAGSPQEARTETPDDHS